MRFMLRPAILIMILLSLGAASCTSGGNGSGQSGSCENELFPVKLGAMWTYASAGGPAGDFSYTDSVTEIHKDGFTVTSQWLNETRTQKWFCKSDGLQPLQISGGNAAGISMQGITAHFSTSEVNGVNLPREISTNAQWQYELKMQGALAMPGEQQSPASGTYSVAMQKTGWETVSVPAGTFHALRVQANSNVQITANFHGAPLPIAYNAVTLLWYAPNVGFIKSVENGDFGGTAFFITTELQNYQVP